MKFSPTKPKQISGNCIAWPKSHVIADSDTKDNQSFSKWIDKSACNIGDENGFQRVVKNIMSRNFQMKIMYLFYNIKTK